MTTLQRFNCNDLFYFNNVNFDSLTETFNLPFYFQYLSKWPEYCSTAMAPSGHIMGYVLGKVEGEREMWHGHVTAVTVAPEYRRQGLADMLMEELENITENIHDAYFVDLFVRQTNEVAIQFYQKLGYEVYRTVLGYYNGVEDAYDMRKAMKRDVHKNSLVCSNKVIKPMELEFE